MWGFSSLSWATAIFSIYIIVLLCAVATVLILLKVLGLPCRTTMIFHTDCVFSVVLIIVSLNLQQKITSSERTQVYFFRWCVKMQLYCSIAKFFTELLSLRPKLGSRSPMSLWTQDCQKIVVSFSGFLHKGFEVKLQRELYQQILKSIWDFCPGCSVLKGNSQLETFLSIQVLKSAVLAWESSLSRSLIVPHKT